MKGDEYEKMRNRKEEEDLMGNAWKDIRRKDRHEGKGERGGGKDKWG